MLGPRYFPRWRERHVVNFNFGSWVPPGAAAIAVGRKRVRQDYKSDDDDKDDDDEDDDVNTHNNHMNTKEDKKGRDKSKYKRPAKKKKIRKYQRQNSEYYG